LIHRLMQTLGMDEGQLSDAQLLERFVLARDEAAFQSLLWRHGPMVLGLCQRMLRHRHDAEDVFQAVFLVFFRKAHSISRRDRVASWLYKVAYRLAVKVRAQTAHRVNDDSRVESLPAPEQPDAFLAADLRPILDDALSRLPEKYRVPLVLHYLEGKSVREAAAEIGCPSGTVAGRLNRARELLRRGLARRGVVLSGAIAAAVLTRAGKAAAMTAVLTSATLDAVRTVAGKSAAAGTVSAAALALAESAARPLPMARWKIATLLLVLGLASLSAGLASWRLLTPPEADPPLPAAGRRGPEASSPAVAPLEDPLPPGARARLGSQRFTYGAFIEALALSPDGTTVAGIGSTDSVVLWDAATGMRQRIISTGDRLAQVCAVDFSPDGTALAVGDSRGRAVVVHSWKTGAGPSILIDQTHEGPVKAVRFAPGGRSVASAGADGVIRVWVPATGEVLQQFAGHRGVVHALAFAPDGKTLASAGADGTVRLRDPTTVSRPSFTCYGHTGAVRALAFSTDGEVLASAGADRRVVLWRPATGQTFGEHNLRTDSPLALTFVDEKSLVVGSVAGGVRLFDIAANKVVRDYRGFQLAVNSVACSRDRRKLVAGGQDGVFLRWDVASGEADEHKTPGHRGPVWGIDVSPSGAEIASGGLDGTVRIWDSVSGQALETYRPDWQTPRRHSYVSAVAFVLGGRSIVAAGADGAIHLWDRQTGVRSHWQAHRGKVTALACCPGGSFLVSAGDDGDVCLWQAATGEKVRTYGGVAGEVRKLAVSSDGQQLAGVAADGTLHLWELTTGRPLGAAAEKGSGLDVAAFSPTDALLAASGGAAALHLWHTPGEAAPPPIRWLDENSKGVALAFAPDGTLALAGGDAVIHLWRLNGPEELGRFAGHQTRINGLVFTPDGKSLVSASDDGTVLIWDVPRRGR
jgi:RNA polymerase sigma factor (sigma-70 family)